MDNVDSPENAFFLRAFIPGQKVNNKDKMKSNNNNKKRQKSITPTS